MSALCSVIELLFIFFVFVNFSIDHVFFVFGHVQFVVFANFSNAIQVLVMYLNLWVYLIVFVFIGCVLILWYLHFNFLYFLILVIFFKCILICECTCLFSIRCRSAVQFFCICWVERNFFSLTIFGGNLSAGDVHSSVTMDRMSKCDNGQAASPYSLEVYSGDLPAHLRSGIVTVFP